MTADDQAHNYKQGAAASRAFQVQAEKAGDTEAARVASESVNANLDRLNELHSQGKA